ncbi:MAG: glycosyl transferase [Clostridia bacterium]|nr:glycosyl transferase [Clostridia bacterium]
MKNNKHAYLIIAHNQFELLISLLKALDYEQNDIYLHIDKKVKNISEERFLREINKSRIFILKNRVNVKWGDFSQIECELRLLETAIKENYSYYHLLSGVDMPLKKQEEIHDFFDRNYGTEFIHFDAENLSNDVYMRVSKYHFFIKRQRNIVGKIINKMILFFQHPINRMKKYGLTYQKGANWFSITNDLAHYVVERRKLIEKAFKHTVCGDEMFLQSIVVSSPFIKNLVSDNFCDNYKNIMYCIDWKRGKPYEYTLSDYDELIKSEMLFARKFNWEKDKEIVLALLKHVQGEIEIIHDN